MKCAQPALSQAAATGNSSPPPGALLLEIALIIFSVRNSCLLWFLVGLHQDLQALLYCSPRSTAKAVALTASTLGKPLSMVKDSGKGYLD